MVAEYRKFLMFGDSITEFCFETQSTPEAGPFSLGAALTDDYNRRMTVLHRGFSGYNSRWGLKILPEILQREPNIALGYIFFGSNDSCAAGHQRVSEEEYGSNLHKLVQVFKSHSIKPIVIGPAFYASDIWEPLHQDEITTGYIRSNEVFARYSKVAADVASEENVPFLDLRGAMSREMGEDWRHLLSDGLHFNSKGYKVFYDELLRTIKDNYPEYHPHNIEPRFPDWKDVEEDGGNLN